jgi:hypothetical protein
MILLKSRASLRRAAIGTLGAALVAGPFDLMVGTGRHTARADEGRLPPRVASAAPETNPGAPPAHPFPPRTSLARRGGERPEASGGWWHGTAGIALALAVCGAISVATRGRWRWPRVHAAGTLRVVGRTSLSPRHTVHLLSIGDRVLIIGTGPQGAPSLLGELTDPDDLQRLVQRHDENDHGNGRAPGPATGEQPHSVVVNWRRPREDDR